MDVLPQPLDSFFCLITGGILPSIGSRDWQSGQRIAFLRREEEQKPQKEEGEVVRQRTGSQATWVLYLTLLLFHCGASGKTLHLLVPLRDVCKMLWER